MADKITNAQQQVIELMTFTAQLQQAATALDRHRPSGWCDDLCGCVTQPDVSDLEPAPRSVALIAKPDPVDEPLIACTLGASSMHGRLSDWHALLVHVERRDPLPNGVRASFARTVPLTDLIDLAAAEQECCQFFDFAITIDTRGIALEVRSSTAALPVLLSLFGVPA